VKVYIQGLEAVSSAQTSKDFDTDRTKQWTMREAPL